MTHTLTSALLHFIWEGAAVAFLLWMALGFLRNRSANARYLVCCGALAAMAVLPLVTFFALYQRPIVAIGAGIVAASQAVMTEGASFSFERWLLPAWFLGVLLFSLRLLWGCGQVAAIRRRGEPADAPMLAMVTSLAARMRLARPVHVLISSMAEGPSAIGWLRPVILLPAATVLGLTPEQLEAVIAHELAHIRRHDYLVNILQMGIETVLFYHPAVWWASARIRHERELCCDDAAVGCCGDALCYARALTTLERLRVTTPRLALGSNALGNNGGSMLYRIERLVGVAKYENSPSRWPAVAAICLAVAVFAANINWAQGQAQLQRQVAQDQPFDQPFDQPGVKTDLGKSTVTERTPVEYPEAAIEKKVEGTVMVEVTLDQTGGVNDARVVSGPQELRRSALQSVLSWHFTRDSGGEKRRVSITFKTPPPGSGVIAQSDREVEQVGRDVGDLQRRLEGEIQRLEVQLENAQRNLETQRANREVSETQKQLEELRRHYGEDYPDVRRAMAQLDKARANLEAQGVDITLPPGVIDKRQQALAEEITAVKAKLDASIKALALQVASGDGKAAITEQATEFLKRQLEEDERKLELERQSVEEQMKTLQIRLQGRLASGDIISLDCKPNPDANYTCAAKPLEQDLLRAKQELLGNMELMKGLEAQMKAQAAQLNVQMNQWKAQRDTLAAQEENFRRRLQEQEKARQK